MPVSRWVCVLAPSASMVALVALPKAPIFHESPIQCWMLTFQRTCSTVLDQQTQQGRLVSPCRPTPTRTSSKHCPSDNITCDTGHATVLALLVAGESSAGGATLTRGVQDHIVKAPSNLKIQVQTSLRFSAEPTWLRPREVAKNTAAMDSFAKLLARSVFVTSRSPMVDVPRRLNPGGSQVQQTGGRKKRRSGHEGW